MLKKINGQGKNFNNDMFRLIPWFIICNIIKEFQLFKHLTILHEELKKINKQFDQTNAFVIVVCEQQNILIIYVSET